MRGVLLLGMCLTACTTLPDETTRCDPGPSPVRRLTRFEYNNTVRDLLGDTTSPASAFGAEEEALGFNNNAANLVTSPALAEKYMRAAEQIAARATTPITRTVSCVPALTGDKECASRFVDQFGRRAFRRPLSDDERELLLGLYDLGREDGGFETGIRTVIEGALQMPQFLYRLEVGAAVEGEGGVIPLDDYEMASRLSYLLWGSMPDDTLLDAAERGELSQATEIESQARRMLADPKARLVVAEFHEQWLDTYRIESVAKDPIAYPEYTPAIGELMRQEVLAFIQHVTFEGDGTLGALLTAPYTFRNAALTAFYGEGAATGSTLEQVDLDPTRRAGLITSGALLTINAHSNQTSPVHRGKLIREQFLCELMPPPPPDVMIVPPEPDPNSSARERFAQHSEAEACRGCHTLMDPIGFGFEDYDLMGRYRELEDGRPIDASGEIVGSDVAGTFDGAVELANLLASSQQVQECYVSQWFRFGYGRGETVDDGCNVGRLEHAFEQDGGNIAELMIALTQSDAFRFRREVQP